MIENKIAETLSEMNIKELHEQINKELKRQVSAKLRKYLKDAEPPC